MLFVCEQITHIPQGIKKKKYTGKTTQDGREKAIYAEEGRAKIDKLWKGIPQM